MLKDKIKSDLLAFKPNITVAHYNGMQLFMDTIHENLELCIYLESYSHADTMFGVTFNVTYRNKDIPVSEVSTANSDDELDEVLHASVRKFISKKIVIVRNTVNVSAVFHNFVALSYGFYSNLIEVQPMWYEWKQLGVLCVEFAFAYRIGRVKLNMMEAEVNKKIKELGSTLFTADMSPEVKAYIAHNYLAKTITYHNKDEANALERSYLQSAYGALINCKCVCQGYAEAYKRILDSQHIPCEVVCGKIKGSTEYHAWNIVQFGGTYYHVDVTWDSHGGGAKEDKYFALNDNAMQSDRIWTRSARMVCNGTRNVLRDIKLDLALKRATYISKGVKKDYLS